MNGKGIYRWGDKQLYEGEYKNDVKEGFGTFTWLDKKISYTGNWLNGKQHGIGALTCKDGTIKQGEWDHGKRVRWLK